MDLQFTQQYGMLILSQYRQLQSGRYAARNAGYGSPRIFIILSRKPVDAAAVAYFRTQSWVKRWRLDRPIVVTRRGPGSELIFALNYFYFIVCLAAIPACATLLRLRAKLVPIGHGFALRNAAEHDTSSSFDSPTIPYRLYRLLPGAASVIGLEILLLIAAFYIGAASAIGLKTNGSYSEIDIPAHPAPIGTAATTSVVNAVRNAQNPLIVRHPSGVPLPAGTTQPTPASQPATPPKPYFIGGDDLLQVRLRGLPNKPPDETKVCFCDVSAAGDIELPLIGNVLVTNKTGEEISRIITKRYADAGVKVEASIILLEARNVPEKP